MKKQSLIKCIILITFGSFCIGQQDMFSSGSNRPRANAGPDIQIIKDQKINLDASRSFIRDGSKLKFEWIDKSWSTSYPLKQNEIDFQNILIDRNCSFETFTSSDLVSF